MRSIPSRAGMMITAALVAPLVVSVTTSHLAVPLGQVDRLETRAAVHRSDCL